MVPGLRGRRRRPPLRSALRATLTLLLLFGLLELSARVYLFGLAGLVPARIDSVHGLNQTGFLRVSSEPRLVYELRPDIDDYFVLVPFRTNSRGLRDREYTLEKPAGTFRVAVIGSSFALPVGVPIEQAFHSLLEERLSREHPERPAQFLNFAVGMYNPEQMLGMLELRALAYDPDLVIFTTTRLSAPRMLDVPAAKPPDLAGIPTFQRSYPIFQSFFWRVAEQRLSHGAPPPERDRVGLLEGAFQRVAAALWEDARPLSFAGRKQPPPAQTSALDRLAELGRRRQLPIALVRLEYDLSESDPSDAELAARCRALALPCHDTRSAFAGTRARDFWIYALDPHPNAAAHAIFADSIESFLRAQGLLPDGGGSS